MQPANAPLALPARPRILVVSLRRIGDVLLTTPLIRSLRLAWPDAAIDALVFRGTDGILAGNTDLDRVIAVPERPGAVETLKLIARLFRRYHLAVSAQSGDRPTFFAVLAGRHRAGLTAPGDPNLGGAFKRSLLQRSVAADGTVHRVDLMLRLAAALGIAPVPELVPPAAADTSAITGGADYAVIHAPPKFRYKAWTAEGWRAVAAGLAQRGLTVVGVGGPGAAERRTLDEIWQGTVAIHQGSWAETAGLIAGARVYVGPDTSTTHLAAALGRPTVALFGPMDPRVWGPWPVGGLSLPWQASGTIQNRGNVWIVQNPLPCLPCTFEGCERHIGSASVCLDELSAEQVLAAVDRALA
jgi:heptosyltransferase-3